MGGERERQRDGVEEAGRARSVLGVHPDLRHGTKMLGKSATYKESSLEKFHIHRAKFNGGPKLPDWQGERWHSSESGPGEAFIEGGG
jgi:hypothetical protein